MALSRKQKLAVAVAVKNKKSKEDTRVAELTAFVNESVQSNIRHGDLGPRGLQGNAGIQGVPGSSGSPGKDGTTHVITTVESLPEDLVRQSALQELKEELERVKRAQKHSIGGGSNSGEGVKYVSVKTATYRVRKNGLLDNGITIFGVNFNGPVNITIPQPRENQIIYINDESGNADSNNITVTTISN